MSVGAHTVIHTPNGDMFVSDLVNCRGPSYIFTWDGVRITLGEIEVEGPVMQIPLRLTLDDGVDLFLADGAKTFRKNKDSTLVRDLAKNDSLLPFYTKTDSKGYPIYREPGGWNKKALTTRDSWNWRRISRLVAEWKLRRRCRPGDVVKHIDGNRRNCLPENLFIEYRVPKPVKQKANFAEPIFNAQRTIKKLNHKVDDLVVDFSREMYFLRGKGITNVAVGGIFVFTDTE